MNSLEYYSNLYKPLKIIKKKNVYILESIEGKYVLKQNKKDVITLYNYLNNRGYNNFPKIIKYRENDYLQEYLDNEYLPLEKRYIELANIVASLHNKTVYYKTVKLDFFDNIRNNIKNNIGYLETYYNSIFDGLITKKYLHPKEYLFVRNYYKIKYHLRYCSDKLNDWYERVKELKKARICIIHNNLSIDHTIYNNSNSYLLSFDNYREDMPLIDIFNFYLQEKDYECFKLFLDEYLNIFPLINEEKSLLDILFNMPLFIDKFDNINDIADKIKHLIYSETLLKEENPTQEIE